MVDCYCGCDTRANRIKFGISAALLLLGYTLMLMPSLFFMGVCQDKLTQECAIILINGDEEDYNKYKCYEAAQRQQECMGKHPIIYVVSAVAVLGQLMMIAASIPMCMLCCCTKKPHQEAHVSAAPAQVVHQGQVYESAPTGATR